MADEPGDQRPRRRLFGRRRAEHAPETPPTTPAAPVTGTVAAPDTASDHTAERGDVDSAPAADEVRTDVEPVPVDGSSVEEESEPSVPAAAGVVAEPATAEVAVTETAPEPATDESR